MISRLSQISDHNVKLSKRLFSSIKVSSHNCRQACYIVIYCGLKGTINKMFLQCCQYWRSPKTDTINGFHAETCPFILRTGTWYSCCCCHKVIFLKEAGCNSHVHKFMYDDCCINIVVMLFGIVGKLTSSAFCLIQMSRAVLAQHTSVCNSFLLNSFSNNNAAGTNVQFQCHWKQLLCTVTLV
jgi:hypothetical protein